MRSTRLSVAMSNRASSSARHWLPDCGAVPRHDGTHQRFDHGHAGVHKTAQFEAFMSKIDELKTRLLHNFHNPQDLAGDHRAQMRSVGDRHRALGRRCDPRSSIDSQVIDNLRELVLDDRRA